MTTTEAERLRIYYANHREERRAYDKHRYRTDPKRRLGHQLRLGYSRAVKAGAPAERITPTQLLEHWQANGVDPLRCYITGEELTMLTRSLDHVVPISRGGSHTLDNILPATFPANNRKQDKLLV